MPSTSYHLIISGLKLMGIKRIFSKNPINYKRLRWFDVKRPSFLMRQRFKTEQFTIAETIITAIASKNSASSKTHLLVFPGGAFISGPVQHHWDSIQTIVKKTNCSVWMVDYPKAPEFSFEQVNANVNEVYRVASERFGAANLVLMGDSAGANLILTLSQRLIAQHKDLPQQLIPISPVMDANLKNPAIDAIDKIDPMLSKAGLQAAKQLYANGIDLQSPSISPLFGSFDGFPKTLLFIGSRDLLYPDQALAAKKMKASQMNLDLVEKADMPHVWPLLPVMKEAQEAMDKIIACIRDLT